MKRTFTLTEAETLTAIARGVIEAHMPEGKWNCSVDLDIDVLRRRIDHCTVTVEAKGDGKEPAR